MSPHAGDGGGGRPAAACAHALAARLDELARREASYLELPDDASPRFVAVVRPRRPPGGRRRRRADRLRHIGGGRHALYTWI